ncbi:hypothetical protein EVAR_597_1 [Eumeta japonica]|uniref:Uncharacterized protein n=1 Tax=Eumeta variegata TaxID=151549 RepID=A0A4C1SE39_EUMVA|nr:hypothetical protein EVAR_597_1 [Eumeta japonica]
MAAWHMSEVNPSMPGPFEVECFKSKPNLSPGKGGSTRADPRSFGWLTTPVGSPSDFRMIRIVSIDTVIREKVSARRCRPTGSLHPVQSKTVSSSWSAPQPLPFRKPPSLHILPDHVLPPAGAAFRMRRFFVRASRFSPLTRDSTRGFSPRVFELLRGMAASQACRMHSV